MLASPLPKVEVSTSPPSFIFKLLVVIVRGAALPEELASVLANIPLLIMGLSGRVIISPFSSNAIPDILIFSALTIISPAAPLTKVLELICAPLNKSN